MKTSEKITDRIEYLRNEITSRRERQKELVLEDKIDNAVGMQDGINRLINELKILDWVMSDSREYLNIPINSTFRILPPYDIVSKGNKG